MTREEPKKAICSVYCKPCEWYGICPHSYAEWDEEHKEEERKDNKMQKSKFNEVLKCLLKNKGITQKEFAKMLGVSEPTVSRFINGSRVPRASTATRIFELLDEPVGVFAYIDWNVKEDGK